jgi:hypothetical protein
MNQNQIQIPVKMNSQEKEIISLGFSMATLVDKKTNKISRRLNKLLLESNTSTTKQDMKILNIKINHLKTCRAKIERFITLLYETRAMIYFMAEVSPSYELFSIVQNFDLIDKNIENWRFETECYFSDILMMIHELS